MTTPPADDDRAATWRLAAGYPPADDHEGFLIGGDDGGPACTCGWRGDPEPDGPDLPVQWRRHVYSAVPELPVWELAEVVRRARELLEQSVQRARTRGASWELISKAAGISRQAAYAQWGGPLRDAVPSPGDPETYQAFSDELLSEARRMLFHARGWE